MVELDEETGLFDKIAPTKTIRVANVDVVSDQLNSTPEDSTSSNMQGDSTLTSSMQKAASPNKMSATSFQSMINLQHSKAEDLLVCSQNDSSSMVVIHPPEQVDSDAEEDE